MPISLLTDMRLSGQPLLDFTDEIDGHLGTNGGGHIIEAYVFSCKHLEMSQPLFNDGIPTVIFMPNSADEVSLVKDGQLIKLKSVWVCCGVIKNIQWLMPEQLEHIFVLRFNLSVFYSAFNVSPSMFLSNPVCSFEDLVDERWLGIINEIYQTDNFEDKIAMMKNALSMSEKSSYLPYLVKIAIAHIDQRKGNTTVSELLSAIGGKVNQRWLQRNFIKYVGMAPKKYISLQRFICTYGLYNIDKSSGLSDAAMVSGYYDYNHFQKDFKQYLGIAPSRYSWVSR
ncbi:helix-turn-helix domain-containing protein [Arcticibacter pallidicorallinus]|nr:helix-turn-helix domain-containing protein [Arcticibacter pallidicorallinus]